MATKWTDEQAKAMLPSNKLTVLSAAAGSGKTTVLVERTLRLLLDNTNPVQADKILIATFSNASAREFKTRIEKGIIKRIEEDPSNNFIKQQRVALQKADISTIHSFCIKLVRENFETLGINPDFKISDNAQGEQIHNDAINLAMEYGYTIDEFKNLVSFFGKSSQDNKIREFLYEMHNFYSALPNPINQVKNMRDKYSPNIEMQDTNWYSYIMDNIALSADYLLYIANQINDLYALEHFTGYDTGVNFVSSNANTIIELINKNDLNNLKLAVSVQVPRIGVAKGKCDTSEAISNLYQNYKKVLTDIQDILVYLDNTKYTKQMTDTKVYVDILVEVYLKYQTELAKIKQEQNMYEFSDFEHMALKLLQNDDGSRTTLATTLMNHYEYIMEDEFQDTSYVQDAIFEMISKDKQANLYVVGDVKQSIYGFRKASPEIFLAKRQIGIDDTNIGNTIFLPHNFRSEINVIKGINHIFNNIMTKTVGGVDYKDGEYLQTLKIDEDENAGVQVKIFEKDEAVNVAKIINDMIKTGYQIKDGDNMRSVTADDFCILLRSKTNLKNYKDAIENYGHNAFIKDDELILNKPEVQSIISLLRVIANPLQEVYVTATMFSDIFGFTLDEVLKIRYIDKDINLYKTLALSDNEKAKYLLDLLKEFNWASSTLSYDKLVDYICKKTGYYSKLAFSKDASEKRENIRWFIAFVKSYSASYQSNLSSFIRWIDLYIKKGSTIANDNIQPKNSINIMTMHVSKGLEYPICFVCGLGSKFNKTDQYEKFMLDVNMGISIFSNSSFGYNDSTIGIMATKLKINTTQADEEMRLLYVAFTRAKNLLVLTANYTYAGFSQKAIDRAAYLSKDSNVHPYALQKAITPIEWVLYTLAQHKNISSNYSYCKENQTISSMFDIQFYNDENDNIDISLQENIQKVNIEADITKITNNLQYMYPFQSRTFLPIKVSVSELAKATPKIMLSKPKFMQDNIISAAQKGTEMHKFIQLCDILLARINLPNEIIRLEKQGMINPALLDMNALKTFLENGLSNKILNAKEVLNEKDFIVPYNAGLALDDDIYNNDELFIQGIIDCVLVNEDKITVIDFKTDRVSDMQTLKMRYQKQLELYKYGAKHLFNTSNVECIIYSFALGEYIIL